MKEDNIMATVHEKMLNIISRQENADRNEMELHTH